MSEKCQHKLRKYYDDNKIQRIENKCGLPKVPSFVSPKDKHTTTNATTTTEHNIDVDMEEDDDDSTISDPRIEL